MKPFEIIRELRKAAGLTQAQMARLMETSRPNYGQKENGNTSFTADELFSALSHLKFLVSDDIFERAFFMFIESVSEEDSYDGVKERAIFSTLTEQPIKNENIAATSYFVKNRTEQYQKKKLPLSGDDFTTIPAETIKYQISHGKTGSIKKTNQKINLKNSLPTPIDIAVALLQECIEEAGADLNKKQREAVVKVIRSRQKQIKDEVGDVLKAFGE